MCGVVVDCYHSLFSLCVCQTNRLVLSAPPSNFDVTIDCSHLPLNSKVRGAELHFWIALTFALHMPSGFTEPRAKQTRCSQARGCMTARQRCSFFFFFNSPTEDDEYVIDFSPTPLSTIFPLQCAKQDWVQAWSMHCFSFSITLEWAEDTKGYAGEVWQRWKQSRASGGPLKANIWVVMNVCVCVDVGERKRYAYGGKFYAFFTNFLMHLSRVIKRVGFCLSWISSFEAGIYLLCLYKPLVTLPLPSYFKL